MPLRVFNHIPSKYLLSMQAVVLFIASKDEFNEVVRSIAGILAVLVGIFTLINLHYKVKLTREQHLTTKITRERLQQEFKEEKKPDIKPEDDDDE